MKHTLLVVDDEPDNVDALERLFRKRYNVIKAISGEEALRLLKTERPSLIISDQRMPNMSGVEFFSASMKSHPEVIRILLTGYTDVESVIGAINSGQVYRYVTKPWDPVDLANTVDKAIERFELSAELKEKNVALKDALSELKTLDAAKTQFMMLINHELKTPLTVMLSFIELMKESGLNAELAKYVDRISQSADRLKALISDSLELVSAEAGATKVKNAKLSTTDVLAVTRNFEVPMAAKKLELGIADSKTKFKSDAEILKNVLTRLMDNAVKFSKDKSTIQVSTSEQDGGVVFEVVNSGKSISQDRIDQILKPFHLDEEALNHSKGTGLGLSVCQALLKRLGSELQIECPSGRFHVSFLIRGAD